MNILTNVSNILLGANSVTVKNITNNSNSLSSTYNAASSTSELTTVSTVFVGVLLLVAVVANAILAAVGVIAAIISIVMNVKKHNNKRTIWSIVLLVLSLTCLPAMFTVEAIAGNTNSNSPFGFILIILAAIIILVQIVYIIISFILAFKKSKTEVKQ